MEHRKLNDTDIILDYTELYILMRKTDIKELITKLTNCNLVQCYEELSIQLCAQRGNMGPLEQAWCEELAKMP